MTASSRLRLRLPNGAEFEASGDAEFVRSERGAFLDMQQEALARSQSAARVATTAEAALFGVPASPLAPATRPGQAASSMSPATPPSLSDWSLIADCQAGKLQLRAKLKNDKTHKDACLVLLAAAQKLLHLRRPTAAQLARWLRASGYPIGRVDRAIAEALEQGEMLASGSRRARRYELTGPGLAKAALFAEQLAASILA